MAEDQRKVNTFNGISRLPLITRLIEISYYKSLGLVRQMNIGVEIDPLIFW